MRKTKPRVRYQGEKRLAPPWPAATPARSQPWVAGSPLGLRARPRPARVSPGSEYSLLVRSGSLNTRSFSRSPTLRKERSGQKKKPPKDAQASRRLPAPHGGRPDECSNFAHPSEEPVGRGRGPGGAEPLIFSKDSMQRESREMQGRFDKSITPGAATKH